MMDEKEGAMALMKSPKFWAITGWVLFLLLVVSLIISAMAGGFSCDDGGDDDDSESFQT